MLQSVAGGVGSTGTACWGTALGVAGGRRPAARPGRGRTTTAAAAGEGLGWGAVRLSGSAVGGDVMSGVGRGVAEVAAGSASGAVADGGEGSLLGSSAGPVVVARDHAKAPAPPTVSSIPRPTPQRSPLEGERRLVWLNSVRVRLP